MHHQLAPSRWTCLVTSFAMALDVPVKELISLVGHDGSEIIWPELPEPYCRRGHHPQELIYEAALLGFDVCPFESQPTSTSLPGSRLYVVPMKVPTEKRMFEVMVYEEGVLTGEYKGRAHAVAWTGTEILDPNGTKYSLQEFNLQTYWKIKSE